MGKPKRKKLIREHAEKLLAKYERRIQRISEEAYQLRQAIAEFSKQEGQAEQGEAGAAEK